MAGKYTEALLREAVSESLSWSDLCRYFGLQPVGGNLSNLQRNVAKFDIDSAHFIGSAHMRGKVSRNRKHFSEYLILNAPGSSKISSKKLRRSMIEYGFIYQCHFDDCPTRNGWINGEITFEIDHINGNNVDNRAENLRFLCAICHSQQPTSSHSWKEAERYSLSPRACECGRMKSNSRYNLCGVCVKNKRKTDALAAKNLKPKPKPRYRDKIDWPPVTDLAVMVAAQGYSATGRVLGVSDNAVRKRVSPDMVRDLTMTLT